MKTVVLQKNLLAAIQTVSKAINRNSVLPILSHAKLRAGAHGLEIAGTDLDNSILVSFHDVAALPELFAPGETCVSARKFADAVKLCHDSIALSANDAGLCVKNGSTFNLATLPTADFPALPQVNAAVHKVTVQCGDLRRALRRVECAQSTDASRYVLNGIYFEFSEHAARLVATDGKRLHVQEIGADTTEANFETKNISALVHSRTIALLLAALPKAKRGAMNEDCRAITIEFGKWNNPTNENSYIKFTFQAGVQSVEITGKQISGNFPLYRQVIPSDEKYKVELNPEQFGATIKAAAAGCSEKQNSVKLSFSDQLLTVTGKSVANAEAIATMPCNWRASEDVWGCSIAFNPEYIGAVPECVKELAAISLHYMSETHPVKITTADGFLAVVMPMRLS